MFVLTLLMNNEYELVKIGKHQLDADIGAAIAGHNIVKYQSGWLKPEKGIKFIIGDSVMEEPLLLSSHMNIELNGDGITAALIVRNVEELVEIDYSVDEDSFTVGRSVSNDLVIKDAIVSSCHGRFSIDGDGALVYADLSKNGTYINGSLQGTGRTRLKQGDVLFIPPLYLIKVNDGSLSVTGTKG